jgi:DNA-binding NarL/FixJ family response regulator
MAKEKINVAILDDHQPIIDGYIFRLNDHPQVEIVATARYGNELDPMLENYLIDVLILDVEVRNDQESETYFPTPHAIPRVLKTYPHLKILVISMHNHRILIKNLLDYGASGYILKDDYELINQLGDVIVSTYEGEMTISKGPYQSLKEKFAKTDLPKLTHREFETLSLVFVKPDDLLIDLAKELGIAASTLRNSLSKIYLKLGVNSQLAAILKAQELGLLPPNPTPIIFNQKDEN